MLLTNSRIATLLIIEKATGLNANMGGGGDARRNCSYYCLSGAVTVENDKNEIKLVGIGAALLRRKDGDSSSHGCICTFYHS